MTSRWKIAVASAASAAVAAVAVLAMSGGRSDDAGATVPPDDSVPASPGGDAGERSITVSGHGTVEVVPDLAHISAGVQANADTAAEAMDTMGTKSQALVDTLTGAGVDEQDIQTSGLNLWPTFTDDGSTVNGYQASTTVTATVRDIDSVGAVLDALKGFVGEELTLGGISFSYEDPEAVLGEARTAAIENARTRAEQYAAAAGTEVGEILRIIEGPAPARLFGGEMEMAAADATSVAIEPGSQDLTADVTVVFAMG